MQPEEEYVEEQRTDRAADEPSAAENTLVLGETEEAVQEVIDGPVEICYSDVIGRSVSHAIPL